MLQLIHKLRQKRIPIVFDPNIRTALWTNQAQMIHELNHLASQAKFVLPGLQEGKIMPTKLQTFIYSKAALLTLSSSNWVPKKPL